MKRPTEIITPAALPSAALTRFLDRSPYSNCYHSPAWLNALCTGFRYRDVSLTATQGDEVVGFLPIMERRNLRGRHEFVALPFSHHVPLIAADAGICDELTTFALRRTRRLIVRDDVAMSDSGLRVDSGSIAAWVDLRDGHAAAHSRFSSMARRGVRKAEREQVHVATACNLSELDAFYDLLVETRQRQGVPIYPRRFLHAVWNNFGPHGSQLWLARHNEAVIAGLWVLLYRGHALYAFGASRASPELLRLRPNNLLFDRAIAALCDAGYQQLDMGSTHRSNTGLIAFKQAWGATFEPIHWCAWPRRIAFAAPARTGLPYRAAYSVFRNVPRPFYKYLSAMIVGRVG